MYSFHPFGGIETHPYGGSIGGSFFDQMSSAADKITTTTTKAKKTASAVKKAAQGFAPSKKTTPTKAQVGTGASTMAFKPMQLNQAALNAQLQTFRKVQPFTPTYATLTEPVYEDPTYMVAGSEGEYGFFETYKNYILIGGAIAVVGAFALYMRNR